VFGDDCVILYTGAIDDTSHAANAETERGASLG